MSATIDDVKDKSFDYVICGTSLHGHYVLHYSLSAVFQAVVYAPGPLVLSL